MEALHNRLKQLNSLHTNGFRVHEHITLDRLMYKNRNQHRRGPYFQRLEHVRRILRRVNNHALWRLVRKATSAVDGLEQKRKTKTKHRKSKLQWSNAQALVDFESFSKLADDLVTNVIPKAALRITMELICREHFIPFAVAALALLARIFSIERTLLRMVQGITVDIRILAAVPKKPTSGRKKREIASVTAAVEDVGKVIMLDDYKDVEALDGVTLQKPTFFPEASKAGRKMVNRFCGPATHSEDTKVIGCAEKCTPSDAKTGAELTLRTSKSSKLGGTLYDLMAEEDSNLAEIAETHIVSSGRTSLGMISPIVQTAHVFNIHSSTAKVHNDGKRKSLNDNRADVKVPSEGSEASEDLDDIFANMSD